MGRMNWPEAFGVLDIAPTKDEDAIKKAYRDRLVVTNPEDDQEGFKRLRAAYEEANRYAARTYPENTSGVRQERDESPSGRWMERVGEVYAHMSTRRDVNAWKALFAEELFWSLEEEENCRRKLLTFLMGHFRLPTDVWRLLDEKLRILKDIAALRESFPAEYIGFIANRCERGEDIDFRHFRGADDADYDLFLQYYDRAWRALEKQEIERARECLAAADAMEITHPAMEICRGHLLEQEGRIEEAARLMEGLFREYPEDIMACFNAAELLWRNVHRDVAAEIFAHIKGMLDSHYMANVRLTEWYYNKGEYKTAKACAEKVLPAGADDAFIELLEKINRELEKELEERFAATQDWEAGMELCWCYLQDGRIQESIQIAEGIRGRISTGRDAEYKGLLAKLSIEAADYERAIEQAGEWERALEEKIVREEPGEAQEKDRDRVRQSYMIRMECFRMIAHDADVVSRGESYKYYRAALREAEQIESGTMKDISMLLEKAQIYKEMEEYEKCLDVTRWLVDRYRIYAAYATAMEAHYRKRSSKGVVGAARECISHFPDYTKAYEYLGRVYLRPGRREELEQLLQEAERNGVESAILNAYQYQMHHEVPTREEVMDKLREFRKTYLRRLDQGDSSCYEEGLAILTEYLYCYPSAYMLVERGVFHRTAQRLDEAEADFQKALADSPYFPYALRELSQVYRIRGKYDKALVCLKKALRFRDKGITAEIYTQMADIYTLMGDYKRAKQTYQIYLDSFTEKPFQVLKNYAIYVGRADGGEAAEQWLDRAYGGNRKASGFYDDVVYMMQIAGEAGRAQTYLEEWKRLLDADKVRIFKVTTPIAREMHSYMVSNYLRRKAWQSLLFGESMDAISCFEKMYQELGHCPKEPRDQKGRMWIRSKGFRPKRRVENDLGDMIFACILLGVHGKGQKYAGLLAQCIDRERQEGMSRYYDRQKEFLRLRFLAEFYRLSDEELRTLLTEETRCGICFDCECAICKEMEAVRILFLLKTGEEEQARKRTLKNLAVQPQDEYMMAIRHRMRWE